MAAPTTGTLSSTLQGVLSEQAEPCEAGAIVGRILELHGDYASGRAKAIAESLFRPPKSRVAPVAKWYDEARQLLISDLGKLSGRTAIVGLAMADLTMGREIVRSGLFTCIVDELNEGLGVLNARGLRRLAQIPRANLGPDTTPIVLASEGPGLVRGGISSDGSRAVGYGDDRESGIRLWNVESGLPLGSLGALDPPRAVRMVRFSPDGSTIVALLRDGSVVRWPVTSFGDRPDEVSPRIDGVASGALATDASCAVKRLIPSGFSVLDTWSGARVDVDTDGQATRICVSPDGRSIAIAIGNRVEVHRRSGPDVAQIAGYDLEHEVRGLECGGGVVVAVSGEQVHVQIVDREQDVPRAAVQTIAVSRPTRVAVARDGSLCAVVGAEGVTVLEPVTGTVFGTLTAQVPAIRGTFSLDSERLLVNHEDGSMRVWDVGLRPSGVRPPPAKFDSDRADGSADYLGRMHDVEAIASLIAATSVEPPLSIGIFGNWGSGKSWFMEQLRRQVAAIAADALASRVPQSDVSFFKRIAQVKFNAWHYAEADVLSSLVEHVFRRLDLGDRGDIYTESKQAAQEKLARASKEEMQAQSELVVAEQELAQITERREATEAIRETKAAQLRHEAEVDATVRTTATAALDSVGWKATGGAAAELIDALRENRRELERSGVILGPLVRGTPKEIIKRRRWAFACAAIGPVLAIVVGAVISVGGEEATAALASAGALLAGVLTGATKLVHDHTMFIRGRVDALTEAERLIEDRVNTALKKLDGQIATEREAELVKREDVERKRQELVDKQKIVATQATELARVTPEQMLEDLVDARIASGDYAKQLGIIALARSDFEKVSSLIEAGNEQLLKKGSTERLDDDTGVNRIVLYIDDLDRCETAKVAKVLQAVHLLLAFPLFVVVVAVDPRWVGRALEKEYPELLDGGDVDPNEYLEKVFQIPFWLDQLDTTRTAAMLQGLAQVSPDVVTTERRARAKGSARGQRSDASEPEVDEDGRTEGTGSQATVDSSQAARSRELNPPALAMDAHELTAMQELAPVLGTSPRALKRFVNIYRLFKVRAEDPADFADKDRVNPDYQVVLYLLAQITGDPRRADQLFESIRNAADDGGLELPGLPEGWPSIAAPYKQWLDEVSRFSFQALLPAVAVAAASTTVSDGTESKHAGTPG
jgi:hypothetical protein